MLKSLFTDDSSKTTIPKEGDLYKEVTIQNVLFRLHYGYYEDFERNDKYNEPIPIYPDFISEPRFTKEGIPFVTAMQDICEHYSGRTGEDSCAECHHFVHCEELFGLCYNPNNKKDVSDQGMNNG